MGKIFGAKENAPTNIAGVVTIVLLIMIGLLIFFPISGDISKSQLLQMLGGFFLAALGYLFGSVSGNRRD